MLNKTKCILIDWGGVCCTAAEPFANKRFQRAVGKTPEEIAGEVKTLYTDYYLGRVSTEQFWQGVMIHYSRDDFVEKELSDSYKQSYVLNEEMLALIAWLKQSFRVILCSNLTPEMTRHIRKTHNTDMLFHTSFFSFEIGLMKPDPAYFNYVLKKEQFTPEECLFIDDSEKNVVVARGLGIQAIHYTDFSQLLLELQARGIRPVFLPNNHSKNVLAFREVSVEEQETVKEVLSQYGFVANRVQGIDLPARNSKNFKVSTNKEVVFLRQHLSTSPEQVIRSHAILQFCKQHGMPVPILLATEKKETLVKNNEQFYAAFWFIEGKNYQGTDEELRAAGHSLAVLHKTLAQLPENIVQEVRTAPQPAYAATKISEEFLTRINALSEKKESFFDIAVTSMLQLIKEKTRECVIKNDEFSHSEKLPLQVIHSDIHPHNIIITKEKKGQSNSSQAVICDFDSVRYSERARDVACSLHRLVRQFIVHETPKLEVDDLVKKAIPLFLEAYEKELQLLPEERSSLSFFMHFEIIQKIHFVLQQHYTHKNKMWDADLAKFIMLLEETTILEFALRSHENC